jgi:NADH-quinone oxidoreductase subunit J
MDLIDDHWLDALPLVLMAAGIWWLMPQGKGRPRVFGIAAALAGAVVLLARLPSADEVLTDAVLFWGFSLASILFAVLMITSRNPVYSALWFALVTLSTCGLFLLRSAPFLAAATVIVYAGAIVVTFVFVIMLAQQSGATVYDQRARQPVVATIAAFLLLWLVLGTIRSSRPDASGQASFERPRAATANYFSRPDSLESLPRMRNLGRSLFGDYLFAVELAGTLLLVATIGAIAIAPRRRRGTL